MSEQLAGNSVTAQEVAKMCSLCRSELKTINAKGKGHKRKLYGKTCVRINRKLEECIILRVTLIKHSTRTHFSCLKNVKDLIKDETKVQEIKPKLIHRFHGFGIQSQGSPKRTNPAVPSQESRPEAKRK